MVLPEAVAIVTSTIAIYTFLRNTVETIVRDRASWRDSDRDIRNAASLLEQIERRVRSWHEKWMTLPEAGAEVEMGAEVKELNALLYEEYWDTKCGQVQSCVENIDQELTDFRPWWEKELKRVTTRFGRIRYVARGDNTRLVRIRAVLPELMNRLDEESNALFLEAHPNVPGVAATDPEIRIHVCGRDYLLYHLASSTFDASLNLYNSSITVAHEGFTVNLVLDFLGAKTMETTDAGTIETRRKTALSKAAGKKCLDFVFITKRNTWGVCMRTLIHTQRTATQNIKMSFLDASNDVYDAGDGYESSFRLIATGYYFNVKNDSNNDHTYDPSANNSVTINEALRTGQLDILGFVKCGGRMVTMRLKQAELAYRLAECGLLLLKTPWLLRICSCSIRQRVRAGMAPAEQNLEYPQQFIFRQGNAQAANCFCANPASANVGCLFHLGILLMEIALGTSVAEVNVPNPTVPNANPFNPFENLQFNPADPSHIQLLQTVLQISTGTVDVGKAVAYCLRNQSRPENITNDGLKEYRKEVLDPLRRVYETRLRIH